GTPLAPVLVPLGGLAKILARQLAARHVGSPVRPMHSERTRAGSTAAGKRRRAQRAASKLRAVRSRCVLNRGNRPRQFRRRAVRTPAVAKPQQPASRKSFHLEIFRGSFAAIADELVLDMLAFVERAQAGPLDRRAVH